MANNNNTKNLNVPNLRFPEFTGEWKETTLGKCVIQPLDYGMNAAAITYDGENKYIRITDIDEQSSQYISDSPVSPAGQLLDKYIVEENDILFARTGASTGKTYLYKKKDGKLYFAGFLIRAKIKTEYNSTFIFAQTKTAQYYKWVEFMSIRSGQPGINSQEYASYRFLIPQKEEQDKIASLLSLLDERITTQIKIIEDLKLLKSAIRDKLYSALHSNKCISLEIKDILDYEQPTKYIVDKDEYSSDSTLVPVLTANKAFILGYTNENNGIYNKGECIIFDDFTMDSKFVNFPFKVKSSAIKILRTKDNFNTYFIFEYIAYLRLSSEEHKRHYISEIELRYLDIPDYATQLKIASILRCIDKLSTNANRINELYLKQKQYLLSNIFI
ncbi:restriction endonuclease subunit S [Bacteroides ovatus]|uniref:restriction endonuclease subunit S n=1 Tax=Bacteroides ovatus TaxID=28116 RepID=UPI00319E3CC5